MANLAKAGLARDIVALLNRLERRQESRVPTIEEALADSLAALSAQTIAELEQVEALEHLISTYLEIED